MDAGLRLRYEIRREFAPYVGVTWSRRFFDTADLATAEGEDPSAARLALGLRLWF
jgi:copper resistance protein B